MARFAQLGRRLDRLIADEAALEARMATVGQYGDVNGFDQAALRAPLQERFFDLKGDVARFLDTVPWYQRSEVVNSSSN